MPILRRWPLVLLIYLLVFGYGLTAIHFLMGKEFDTQGSIQISSSEFHSGLILPPKISEAQRYNDKRRYINYKYTQAELLGSDIVLNRAIDELKDKNIVFFPPGEDPLTILREMFVNQGIAFETLLQNEFIYVKMTTEYPRDAEQLIDALLRGYMSFLEESEEDRVRRLTVLEKRKRILEDQLEMQRLKIRQGSSELTSRQEMMLQQVATLQETLVEVTIRKILLETQVALKEKNANREITVEDIADQPTDVVESDPIVQPLSWDIRLYEGILRSERETIRLYEGIVNKNRAIMNPSNPVLKRNTEILEEFQRRHKKIEATVALRINEQIEKKQEQIRKQIAQMQRKKLEQLQEELNQMTVYENRIRAKLEEKMGTIGLGLKQFEIEEAQEEFARIMDDYHEIHLGINEVHIEVFSNPQISIASNARSVEAKGKRRKMAGAAAFGGLVMGMGVALLRGKLD